MSNTIKVLSAFVLGTAAGFAAGILMAPDKGEKTRKKLLEEMDKVSKDVAKQADKQMAKLKEGYNKKVEELSKGGKELMENAKKAVSVN